MKKPALIFIPILVLMVVLFLNVTPAGVEFRNEWIFGIKKVDEQTNYNALKKVEDTARAMQSSYTADKLTYDQYKVSDNEEKKSWAEQAKMRANKTAASYNRYILENTFLWKDGVPSDISNELAYLED